MDKETERSFRANMRSDAIEKAATIAAWYGLTVSTGGDPRGYTVKLHGDQLPRSDWGGGFGVA